MILVHGRMTYTYKTGILHCNYQLSNIVHARKMA